MIRPRILTRLLSVRDQTCSLAASLVAHATLLGLLAAVILPIHSSSGGGYGISGGVVETALADDGAPVTEVQFEQPGSDSPAAGGSQLPRAHVPEETPGHVRLETSANPLLASGNQNWGGLNAYVQPGNGGGGQGDGNGAGDGVGDGTGAGNGDAFFGIRHPQRRTMFVVDGSRSMNAPHPGAGKTRFGRVKLELLRSIGGMREEQQFFMVFFADLAVPMPATRMVEATPAAKDQHLSWMAQLHADGNTNPEQALLLALSLRPDVIYFLTDGVFEYSIVRKVTAANVYRVPIHTIGFGDGALEKPLRDIADKNGGTYKFIPAEDAAPTESAAAPAEPEVPPTASAALSQTR